MNKRNAFEAEFSLTHAGEGRVPVGWFSISHRWHELGSGRGRESKRNRRGLRGRWFSISSYKGTVYRILKYDPTLGITKNHKAGEMGLDWDGRISLSDHPDGEVRLKVAPVGRLMTLRCAWDHPNPTDRLAFRIALVLGGLSVFLGIVGIGLGLLALGG